MTTPAEVKWSIDGAVVEMMDAGVFGPGSEVISSELDVRYTGQDQYASTVYFGTVTVRDRDGKRHCHQLVFKLKIKDTGLRELYYNDMQFHNEILFYERILPLFLTGSPTYCVPLFARYYYGRNNCGDLTLSDTIVLENVSPRGYRLSEQKMFLDRDHMIVALKTLAKFHGLSYRAKHQNLTTFTECIADVKEVILYNGNDEDWFMSGGGYAVNILFSTVLDRLAQRGVGADDSRVQRFRTKFMNDMNVTLNRVVSPDEPLAILCHGDFNRNNLLFRYDDAGRPVDALPFDFANMRYGSPALDLSFFLYLNTNRQLRDEHWDELLDTYCETLAAAVSDVADVVHVPDRTQLDAEILEYGIFGLVHVSYFVRIMVEGGVDLSIFVKADGDKTAQTFLSFGGDKATDIIADAFEHFMDTFCSCSG